MGFWTHLQELLLVDSLDFHHYVIKREKIQYI